MRKVLVGILLFLWMLSLVAMHLFCFDLFGDNYWLHYVIAITLLFVQVAIILLVQRTNKAFWVFLSCFVFYCILCAVVTWFLASAIAIHDTSPQGLAVWALLLDLIGACFCFFNWFKARKKAKK